MPVFVTLGLAYAVPMSLGAYVVSVPAPGWSPAGWTRPAASPMVQDFFTSVGPAEAAGFVGLLNHGQRSGRHFVANLLVRAVAARFHEPATAEQAALAGNR